MNKKMIAIIAKEIDEEIIQYYNSLKDFKNDIFVITPDFSNEIVQKYTKINFTKDEAILDKKNYPKIKDTDRPGWYYQQLLKYQVVLTFHEKYNYDFVYVIDGDSYIKEDLLLEENIYYTPKLIESEYQNFIDKTNLNLKDSRNFITNQMCYRASYLINMLKEISDNKDWIDVLLDIIIKNNDCWFSEYQIYAIYVKYRFNVLEKPIKVFRRLDLINVTVTRALSKYSVLAKEVYHSRTFLHVLRAKIYFSLGINLG